jgi:hypothetical protein
MDNLLPTKPCSAMKQMKNNEASGDSILNFISTKILVNSYHLMINIRILNKRSQSDDSYFTTVSL